MNERPHVEFALKQVEQVFQKSDSRITHFLLYILIHYNFLARKLFRTLQYLELIIFNCLFNGPRVVGMLTTLRFYKNQNHQTSNHQNPQGVRKLRFTLYAASQPFKLTKWKIFQFPRNIFFQCPARKTKLLCHLKIKKFV